VQLNEDGEQAEILGFSFAASDDLDYNHAFGYLFLDEVANMTQI